MKKNKNNKPYCGKNMLSSSLSKKHISIFKRLFITSTSIVLIICLFISIFIAIINFSDAKLDPSKLKHSTRNSLAILDNNENNIFGQNDNMYCVIDTLQQHTIDAFVSIEDKRFFSHKGIDYQRVASAMITNIKNGKIVEGGSTISQQIIKNTHLSSKKTFDRKLKEAQLATKLEKQYSKKEILEMYLNIIYFGNGVVGIENASQRFFGKASCNLTIMESAMLASIPKSPTKYNLIYNLDNNKKRSKVVLSAMRTQGKITQNDYDIATSQDIVMKNNLTENTFAKSYTQNAIFEACKILKLTQQQLQNSNFVVIAEEKYSQNCDFTPNKVGVCIDNSTRGIVAFESNCPINVFEYRRQLGSSLKPLAVYAPAFDLGIANQYTLLDDIPTDFNGYSPRNYKDIYLGKASAKDCLINSQNVAAVQLMSQVGIENSINYLRKMNFAIGKNDYNQSLALGSVTNGNTFLELCGGYTTLANGGQYAPVGFVKSIVDDKNKIVFDRSQTNSKNVFSKETCYQITDALQECAKNGTAKKLAPLDIAVASKTGTVSATDKNFNTDIYNVSYTPRNTIAFWQGSLKGQLMPSSMSGGGQTTMMAKSFLTNCDNSILSFDTPSN
ncbi:MAG: transglycosylase domain-containing protein, partial [Clostridia bacterium]